ncbi:MAG TPA: transglutaminase domain-containing protein [Chitinophagaceae bacterium]|nr:transglutaminase domain-containing protein [Chitinophagaceae bacterium]
MKKSLLIFLVLIMFARAEGQESLKDLSLKLVASCHSDKEKVARIFQWVTSNISYRVSYKNIRSSVNADFDANEDEEDTSALKPLNERVAERVFKTRLAVCDGYSRLLATMCEYAEIPAAVIIGYGRPGSGRPRSFGVNHYWNAVYFEGQWHLLDATWASGYIIESSREFVRSYSARYFLTDPAVFINDHYPDDQRWTLLDEPVLFPELKRSPFKQKSFRKYNISEIYPSKGVLETYVGDTLRFELITSNPIRDKNILPDLLVDSSLFDHSNSWVFLKPDKDLSSYPSSSKFSYSYPVQSESVEWIYLQYNEDIVLRYRVKTKRKDL